jgi:Fuc2NAc and GlcNAc transferase
MPSGLLMALAGGGGIVAAIGYADDRRSVSPGVRLVAHFGAAAWALFWMGGLPPIQVGVTVHDLGLAGDVIAAFGIVWVLNLFNFMDGIDGIAATEAIFITGVGAFLSWWLDSGSGVSSSMLVIAAASSGFLVWNWPPARIFMGDVGSGFLGFVVAVLALAAARTAPASLFVWLILGGCFFADATVTLVRRVLRGVRVHDAHREHAYQRLSRRWQSHRAVDLVFIAVNAGWLAPCAWLATTRPDCAAWLAGIALFPLVVAAALVGAGRPE